MVHLFTSTANDKNKGINCKKGDYVKPLNKFLGQEEFFVTDNEGNIYDKSKQVFALINLDFYKWDGEQVFKTIVLGLKKPFR